MAWNEIGEKSNQGTGGNDLKDAFLKLEKGTNTVRVIQAEPVSRWTHWIPQANNGKGSSVKCPGKGCPVCEDRKERTATKAKQKYTSRKSHSINVIDRKTGTVKILDKGNGVFGKMKVLMDEMGDLQGYDIKIIQTGDKFEEIEYNVLPVFPPKELSAQDKELAKNLYDLEEAFPTLTIDEINKLLAGASYDDIFKERSGETSGSVTEGMPDIDFTEEIHY